MVSQIVSTTAQVNTPLRRLMPGDRTHPEDVFRAAVRSARDCGGCIQIEYCGCQTLFTAPPNARQDDLHRQVMPVLREAYNNHMSSLQKRPLS